MCESVVWVPLSPRGHCLWAPRARTRLLSVSSLICVNCVSPPAHSQPHIHAYTPHLPYLLSLLPCSRWLSVFSGDHNRSRLRVAGCACVLHGVTHAAEKELQGLPLQLQRRQKNAFVTYIKRNFQSKSHLPHSSHTSPRSTTVTHIFLVFHLSSHIRVCSDARAQRASWIQTTWTGS